MTDTNPYSPPDSDTNTSTAIQHTSSLRAESWRGFKLGTKLTAIVMTAILIALAVFVIGMFVYACAVTNGDSARSVEWLAVLRVVGGTIVASAMTSLYGGITGAVVMGTAAVVRKFRRPKTIPQDAD